MNQETLTQIEQIIEYRFTSRNLLIKAFTHSSSTHSRFSSNERLEFLGDSVLGVVVCRELYERFPDYLEGDLTKIKSMIVSRRTCAQIARQLGLYKFLKIGKGMVSSSSLTRSVAAGVIEALIAAIYIDGGFDAAGNFIIKAFGPVINQADAEHSQGNYKSLLQQHAQQQLDATPVYQLLDEQGPDHNKCFESEVVINGRHFPGAWGTTKKEAEQKAAHSALVELGVIEDAPAEPDCE